MEMDKKQAWELLAQVCALFKGNLEEHKALQKALEVLKPEEPKNEEVKPS